MASRKVPVRYTEPVRVNTSSGVKRIIPLQFWKNVRSLIAYANNRILSGFTFEPINGMSVTCSSGQAIHGGKHRFYTGGAVSFAWSGPNAGDTVVYIDKGNTEFIGAAGVKATLSSTVPEDALIVAYIDTRTTNRNTVANSIIKYDARPSLWQRVKPFVYWV